jgi:hypothetical protein
MISNRIISSGSIEGLPAGHACIPQQIDTKELAAVGMKYLEDHPDRDSVLDDSAAN